MTSRTRCSTSSTPPRPRRSCASRATRPGHYSFAHALIQHTLYEDLGPTRRARAHRQVAEALEELCGAQPGARVGELARHWTLATTPVDLTKAIEYSRQAGDAALRSLAPSDALRYYEQARELFEQSGDRRSRARASISPSGSAPRSARSASRRSATRSSPRRARPIALDDTAAARRRRARHAPRTVLQLRRDRRGARRDLRGVPGAHRARRPAAVRSILAAYCQEVVVGTPLERRQELADEAFAIARGLRRRRGARAGDGEHRVRADRAADARRRSCERTAEGRARAERLGDPVLEFFACNWRRGACAQVGQPRRDGQLHRAHGRAQRRDRPAAARAGCTGSASPGSPRSAATPTKPSGSPPRRSRSAPRAASPTRSSSSAASS